MHAADASSERSRALWNNYFGLGLPRTYTVRNFYAICLHLAIQAGYREQLQNIMGKKTLDGKSCYFGYDNENLWQEIYQGKIRLDVDMDMSAGVLGVVNPPVFMYHYYDEPTLELDTTFTAIEDTITLNPYGSSSKVETSLAVNKLFNFIINKPNSSGDTEVSSQIAGQFIQIIPQGGWPCCPVTRDPRAQIQFKPDHVRTLMARYIRNLTLFSEGASSNSAAVANPVHFSCYSVVTNLDEEALPVDPSSPMSRFATHSHYVQDVLNPLVSGRK